MAKGSIALYIERVLKLVEMGAQDMEKQLDKHFAGEPFGAHPPTAEETAGFVQMVLQKDPPAEWLFPDGHTEINSGWIIAVRENGVEGGKQAYRRIERALGQYPMGGSMPPPPPQMPMGGMNNA